MVRNGVVFCSSRELQAKGELSAASAVLAAHLSAHPAAGEVAIELVRAHLKAGHVTKALDVLDVLPLTAAPEGVALRLRLERTFMRMLQSFDVAGAVAEADRLIADAGDALISALEAADAGRIHARILRTAAIYREIDKTRAAEALNELAVAAGTLLEGGWVEEGLSAALMLAQWQSEAAASGRAFRIFADDAERRGRKDYAADALLMDASRLIKSGGPSAEIQALLARAVELHQALGNDMGLIDVAHVEALMRIDRLNAALSELEDVLHAYEPYAVPRRQLAVALDLSVAAHQQGDLEAAKRYRVMSDRIAHDAGLTMTRAGSRLSEADLLMRSRDLPDAIDLCKSALAEPMPRLMHGNFEQFLATAYAFADDRVAARHHLDRALADYASAGAEDLASIAITKSINDCLGSGDEDVLRLKGRQAAEWSLKDIARGDFEAASTKHQLRAQTALQLYRVSRMLAGDPQLLADAEAALSDAVTVAEKLSGKARATAFGNIAQLSGQIAVWRNDPEGAEEAYRNAIDIFDNAHCAMEAANSRYIIGCMRLNACLEAARKGDKPAAARHFANAETELKSAQAYYDSSGMRSEAARSLRMIAQLYNNGRQFAPAGTADDMRTAALSLLTEAEAVLDDMRAGYDAGNALDMLRGKQAAVSESRQIYALALSIESERQDAHGQVWTWHQRSRARTISDALSRAPGIAARAVRDVGDRDDLSRFIAEDRNLSEQRATGKPAARPGLRKTQADLRLAMAQHPELSGYLELVTGKVPSIDTLSAMIDREGGRRLALVDFVSAGSRIGVMVTTRDGVKPVSWLRAEPQLIEHLAAQWSDWESLRRRLLTGPDVLHGLDRLIAPLAELTAPDDHLVLCPSGPLVNFPLHAFDLEGQPLIARNLVSYAPSIAVWRTLMTRQHQAAAAQDRVIADPTSDRPASRIVGERIAGWLGVAPAVGRAATRHHAIAALKDAHILHIQGHATFNRADPLRSKLILSDAALTAADIVGLGDVDASAVVLGSCEGAAVHMGPGDEPMGLSTALLMAGARSVIAPLWPVDEDDAAAFMEAFYRHLLSSPHRSLAEAVRHAQLTLRSHPRYASPYSWAAYMLHGDAWLR